MPKPKGPEKHLVGVSLLMTTYRSIEKRAKARGQKVATYLAEWIEQQEREGSVATNKRAGFTPKHYPAPAETAAREPAESAHPAFVGESGPEVVRLPHRAKVTPTTCPHPVGMRIDNTCTQCGKAVKK